MSQILKEQTQQKIWCLD